MRCSDEFVAFRTLAPLNRHPSRWVTGQRAVELYRKRQSLVLITRPTCCSLFP